MIEKYRDVWWYLEKPDVTICVTTNGSVRNDGAAVMGRGVARQAASRFPDLPYLLGRLIRSSGNLPFRIRVKGRWLMSFPVKHRWFEEADPNLIRASADILRTVAKAFPTEFFILPRPGCGCGGLKWKKVKPLLKDLPDNVIVITKPT